MLKSNQYLGGRLPLLDPKVLSPDQRDLYQRLDKTMISWATATGFRGKTEDGCLIGPFSGAQACESERTGPYRCELRT